MAIVMVNFKAQGVLRNINVIQIINRASEVKSILVFMLKNFPYIWSRVFGDVIVNQ